MHSLKHRGSLRPQRRCQPLLQTISVTMRVRLPESRFGTFRVERTTIQHRELLKQRSLFSAPQGETCATRFMRTLATEPGIPRTANPTFTVGFSETQKPKSI